MALVSRTIDKEAAGDDMKVKVRVTALNYFNPIRRAKRKAKAKALFEQV